MNKGRKVWWFPAPREGEIVPDYPPVDLTGDVEIHHGPLVFKDEANTLADEDVEQVGARLRQPMPSLTLVTFDPDAVRSLAAKLSACRNCERCTWNPGPDCGRAEHPHCPTCGHCEYRHE